MNTILKNFLLQKINELNTNCKNKKHGDFCEWTINDIYDSNNHRLDYRDYCYFGFGTYELCSKCHQTLIQLEQSDELVQFNNLPMSLTLIDIYELLFKMSLDINKIKEKLDIE
jgi:hypothetical protein